MSSREEQSTLGSEAKGLRPKASKLSISLWCLVIIGVMFRFYNLDKKLFWYDETITLHHASGYTLQDMYNRLITGNPIRLKEFDMYQRINPDRGPSYVLHSVAVSQPEHAPLFYLIAYFWVKTFGCTVGAMRCLPAILSLLQLPCIYWLAVEIFAYPLAAELALALMALSPIQLLYAQELREYSFFSGLLIFASAAFMRAIRKSSLASWALYLFSLVISWYTSILSVFVVAAHALYLVAQHGLKWNKVTACFVGAVFLSIVAFLPWLIEMAHNAKCVYLATRWVNESVPIAILANTWFDNIARTFVDLGQSYAQASNCLSAFVLLIVSCAAYELLRKGRKQPSFLIVTLFCFPAVVYPILDLVVGGQRSLYVKYMMTMPAAVILAVTYSLQLHQRLNPETARWFWRAIACYLLACEVASCIVISQASIWVNKEIRHQDVVRVADILNKDQHAALISEDGDPLPRQTNFFQMLVFSRLVRPDMYFEFSDWPKVPTLIPGIDHYYIFNPSKESLQLLNEHGFTVVQVDEMSYLFLATLRAKESARRNE